MAANFSPPGYRWFHAFRNAPVRIGAYTGVCLSVVFTCWILLANRVPFLEPLARQRNMLASALLILIAAMPVVRFLRSPADLLISGLLAWSLLTFTYRILTLSFSLLEEYYSALHVFVLGAVVYLIFATLSWIGIIVWRARAAQGTHTSR
jgi:small-conductance mechanosensitive channel